MDMIELADLTPDPNNANLGTERGAALLEQSIERYGLGRSIVTDRDGVILAGNKTFETAAQMGFDKARLVETDGTELVVVRRTDLEAGTPQAVGLALADNRAGQVNLQWDYDVVQDVAAAWPEETEWQFPEVQEFNPADHWGGMPEFEQEDQMSYRTLKIHFENERDLAEFSKLIDQALSDKTKSIWYPAKQSTKRIDKQYVNTA